MLQSIIFPRDTWTAGAVYLWLRQNSLKYKKVYVLPTHFCCEIRRARAGNRYEWRPIRYGVVLVLEFAR